MPTVAVLGAGNMGTALAQTLAGNGQHVRLWSIETDVLEEIGATRTNSKYLPGVDLHERIAATWTIEEAAEGAWLVVFSVPSQIVRSLAKRVDEHLHAGHAVLNVAKGLEEGTQKRLSEVLAETLTEHKAIAALGGPAIAGELARGHPTAVIVGCGDENAAAEIQSAFQNDFLKMEATTDVAGVELGGCIKNVYAIALGMCDGLSYGANTKAFVATLAAGEMASLFEVLGGRRETALGLAGLGDLLTTGYSAESRNRTFGERLINDPEWREFLAGHTVEGAITCPIVKDLAVRHGLTTPLLDTVHDVVCGEAAPAETLPTFLRRFRYA